MQPRIKTEAEITAMRQGGKILAGILEDLKKQVQVGRTGLEIDSWVEEQIKARGAEVTYKTDEVNFPGSICISINDEIVHGIPSTYKFKAGDLVSFDLVITYKGMKVDSAFTMVVGEDLSGDKKRLLDITEKSLYAGIDAIKGSIHTGDIGFAIEQVLLSGGLGVVKDLVGHGVGHMMQQPPEVPNYGRKGSGVLLKPGDTIAIEPMATLGSPRIASGDDGWTILTYDGSLSAHFEHTILVTETGAEVLTSL